MNLHQTPETKFMATKDSIGTISRRQLLQGLSAMMACSLWPTIALAKERQAELAQKVSFDDFLSFSKRVTGYHQLDYKTAKQLFTLFEAEPWGMDHLQRVSNKLSSPTLQQLLTLDKGEHWFLGHFLTSWITGIYYHSSGNHMISYEHALMYDAFTDIRPTPGFSEQKFGFWSKAPDGLGPKGLES